MIQAMETISPSLLSVHPILAAIPNPPDEQEATERLQLDVEARGLDEPLAVDEQNRVVNGRRRLRVVLGLNHPEVRIERVPNASVVGIILASLVHRRHFTKGALAYVVFPLLEPSLAEAQKRQLAVLKQGPNSPSSTQWTTGRTVEEIAHQCGFGRSIFYQAKDVHKLFGQQAVYKAKMEGMLLAGETSLQGVLAGFNGQQNAGQPRRLSDQLDLFGDTFGKLRYHFQRTWVSMDPNARKALVPQVRDTVAEMPPEVRGMFEKEIRAAKKTAKAKGGKA